MTIALEILTIALLMIAGLTVLSCALLAGWADYRLMRPARLDSDFEEA